MEIRTLFPNDTFTVRSIITAGGSNKIEQLKQTARQWDGDGEEEERAKGKKETKKRKSNTYTREDKLPSSLHSFV